jgi:hypothetical protein
MNVLLIPAGVLMVLTIAFATLFTRMIFRDRIIGFPDDSEGMFSPARYRVIDRLLGGADESFLRS